MKEKFSPGEKEARLDIRIRKSIRDALEDFCKKNDMRLTYAVTEAIKQFINYKSK